MSTVRLAVGPIQFVARLERAIAPRTCHAFEALLPFRATLIQARWSGEAAWAPLGDLAIGVGPENATSYPGPGEVLFYPGGYSETELLVPYGPTCFASKMGQLAGNHFLTIVDGRDNLKELGHRVLYDGAQPIEITALT